MYVDASLNGKLFQASLNTTSRWTTFSGEFAHKLFGLGKGSPDVLSESEPDGTTYYYASTMRLEIAGVPIDDPRIWLGYGGCDEMITDRGAYTYGCDLLGAYPLRLGISVLEKLHFYLANKEMRVYITPASPNAATSTGQ